MRSAVTSVLGAWGEPRLRTGGEEGKGREGLRARGGLGQRENVCPRKKARRG